MLKKIRELIANPFEARKPKPAPTVVPGEPTHPHSFSCPCKPCCAHTDSLTRERLRRQTGKR
jgi:hypothetical protein